MYWFSTCLVLHAIRIWRPILDKDFPPNKFIETAHKAPSFNDLYEFAVKGLEKRVWTLERKLKVSSKLIYGQKNYFWNCFSPDLLLLGQLLRRHFGHIFAPFNPIWADFGAYFWATFLWLSGTSAGPYLGDFRAMKWMSPKISDFFTRYVKAWFYRYYYQVSD